MTLFHNEHIEVGDDVQKSHEEIIHKLDEVVQHRAVFGNDAEVLAASKRTTDFSKKLIEKYPDYKQYTLWHVLAGSTPKDEKEHFDFPGEDSVEAFIEGLGEVIAQDQNTHN